MEVKESAPKWDRWERIDGVIYDMSPPPSSGHQSVVGNLYGELYAYLKGKTCRAYVAPFAVYLDGTVDGNYVEPDLTIVCDPAKIQTQGCFGAPDMVVEVLSPSTAVKDKGVKLQRYRLSGVREVWIVDPSNQYLEVYQLIEEDSNQLFNPTVYAADEVVQVGIFDDLKVSLHDVFLV